MIALLFAFALHAAEPVDLILVLATDVSASISDSNFRLQKNGIMAALRDPEVAARIEECAPGGVALAYVEWSRGAREVVPFRKIQTASDLSRFASALSEAKRSSRSDTNVAAALATSRALARAAPFEARRRVIDVSSNGQQNVAEEKIVPLDVVQAARDETVSDGFVVNALVIDESAPPPLIDPLTYGDPLGEAYTLPEYYRQFVIGGPGAFVQVVRDYGDVHRALKEKLRRELCSPTA